MANAPQKRAARLAREIVSGRYQPGQSVQVREIADHYELDGESVLKTFAELQALGMVNLIGNSSAIIHSPNPKEMQEAYQVRAALEEIAGRTAAPALKGKTTVLQNELNAMRAAVRDGNLDAYAEHDAQFHRGSSRPRGMTCCFGYGTHWGLIYEFAPRSAKSRRPCLKSLNRTSPSSMLSRKVAEEKLDCCCAIMSKLSWSISENRNRTQEFTERFAGIWKEQRTFNKPFSLRRVCRFRVYRARPSTNLLTRSGAITTTFFRCRKGDGASRSEMSRVRESVRR